jgi:DNA modification methylase
MQQPKTERLPASKLAPAAYNPRLDLKPGDPSYEKLLRSLEEFGYVEIIVWNKRTGHIVSGHQRFKVLRQLGYEEVECVVVDIDPEREKILNISLNKIRGDWDIPKLTDLLKNLEERGYGLDITGFELEEAHELYNKLQRKMGKIVEDNFDAEAEAEQIETPITRPGDLWLIGKHRLLCGDSTDAAQIERLMGGAKAKMCFTDPPWNVDYGGAAHPNWKKRSIKNDNMSSEEFYAFLLSAFNVMAGVSEPGSVTYIAMSAQEWGSLMHVMREAGYHWSSTIIWAKDSFVLSRKDFNTQYEPLWYGWREGAARLCKPEEHNLTDLWQIPRPKKSPDHPTTKPIALAGKAILYSSRIGDPVLDLFGGSGTTLLACEQSDRVCYMAELDEKYCDVICRRAALFRKSNEDIFLLRDGEKIPYSELAE